MSHQRPDHVMMGLVFVFGCLILGVVVFVVTRPPSASVVQATPGNTAAPMAMGTQATSDPSERASYISCENLVTSDNPDDRAANLRFFMAKCPPLGFQMPPSWQRKVQPGVEREVECDLGAGREQCMFKNISGNGSFIVTSSNDNFTLQVVARGKGFGSSIVDGQRVQLGVFTPDPSDTACWLGSDRRICAW